MAFIVPMRDPTNEHKPQVLLIILTKDELGRMRMGDPFELLSKNIRDIDLNRPISNLDIIIAYEEDKAKIKELGLTADMDRLMNYILRGRQG